MANLTATPGWDAVPQLETTTPALGGAGGIMNSQAQALLNRSEQIKSTLALKADLVSGKIPAGQLPSFVDDVLEYATTSAFPGTGETGKIYLAVNGAIPSNPTRQYRWTGSVYAEINPSPGTTDALTEGTTNLYFTGGRVLSTLLNGLSIISSVVISSSDSIIAAFGKLQAQLNLRVSKDSDTGQAQLPSGTTAQRGTPDEGKVRYNKDSKRAEIGNGTAWGSLGGAAGGGNDSIFYESDITMTTSYTLTTGKNAVVAGPLTVSAGALLEVPPGSRLTVV